MGGGGGDTGGDAKNATAAGAAIVVGSVRVRPSAVRGSSRRCTQREGSSLSSYFTRLYSTVAARTQARADEER